MLSIFSYMIKQRHAKSSHTLTSMELVIDEQSVKKHAHDLSEINDNTKSTLLSIFMSTTNYY